jgi:hypothetical protein
MCACVESLGACLHALHANHSAFDTQTNFQQLIQKFSQAGNQVANYSDAVYTWASQMLSCCQIHLILWLGMPTRQATASSSRNLLDMQQVDAVAAH